MQFQNAMIYTEKFRFEHGAFAVENGRFARVLGQPGPDAVDLHGAYVIPGLLDIHTHGQFRRGLLRRQLGRLCPHGALQCQERHHLHWPPRR